MRVSTTQFSLEPVQENEQFWQRVESLILQASADRSQVVLFPEYFSLSWLLYRIQKPSYRENLQKSNELLEEFLARFQKWADQTKMTLIAGTVPVLEGSRILNRSFILRPEMPVVYQDKIKMTRFENEEWQVSAGENKLTLFTIGEFLCAITTCYDVEFPAVTAMAAEQGVEILFVPSCTDDMHGYWRVRHCAQARTIENQCFAVMSSIVGGHPQWPEIESHYGQGGIYTPCDVGMPEGGVQKLGILNQEGLITAELCRETLLQLRKNGTVLNLRDSAKQ